MYSLPHTGIGALFLAAAALVQTAVGALLTRLGRRR
jgi:LPXTG-motif cell wall-anchored protein